MAFDYDGTHDLETSLQDSFGEAKTDCAYRTDGTDWFFCSGKVC